jgi:hypothetical protein
MFGVCVTLLQQTSAAAANGGAAASADDDDLVVVLDDVNLTIPTAAEGAAGQQEAGPGGIRKREIADVHISGGGEEASKKSRME